VGVDWCWLSDRQERVREKVPNKQDSQFESTLYYATMLCALRIGSLALACILRWRFSICGSSGILYMLVHSSLHIQHRAGKPCMYRTGASDPPRIIFSSSAPPLSTRFRVDVALIMHRGQLNLIKVL
jgi:hypothetical protein